MIVGGGKVGPEIVERFIALAGGKEAEFVWIPTAGDGEPKVDPAATFLGRAGVKHIAVLHTRDPKVPTPMSSCARCGPRAPWGWWVDGSGGWRTRT